MLATSAQLFASSRCCASRRTICLRGSWTQTSACSRGKNADGAPSSQSSPTSRTDPSAWARCGARGRAPRRALPTAASGRRSRGSRRRSSRWCSRTTCCAASAIPIGAGSRCLCTSSGTPWRLVDFEGRPLHKMYAMPLLFSYRT